MRVVIQRALSGQVTVEDEIVGRLERPGLVLLLGVTHADTTTTAERLADKVWSLRILDEERSASDVDAPILVISQFTLYANTRKGRRPTWNAAAPGHIGEPLVDHFVASLRGLGATVETGIFGAMMRVSLVNDGPVTIIIDTDTWS